MDDKAGNRNYNQPILASAITIIRPQDQKRRGNDKWNLNWSRKQTTKFTNIISKLMPRNRFAMLKLKQMLNKYMESNLIKTEGKMIKHTML